MEIATHPILRATRANRENPIHSHPTRVCVSCVTNTGLPKSADLRSRTAGKADQNASRFLDWPGGEAVKHGPAPRSGGRSIAFTVKTIPRLRANFYEDLGIDSIRALSTLFTDSEVVNT